MLPHVEFVKNFCVDPFHRFETSINGMTDLQSIHVTHCPHMIHWV